MVVALTRATLRALEVPEEGLPALVEQVALLAVGAVDRARVVPQGGRIAEGAIWEVSLLPGQLGHTGDDLLVQKGRCCLLSKLPLHYRETPLDQDLWHTGHGPFMKLA